MSIIGIVYLRNNTHIIMHQQQPHKPTTLAAHNTGGNQWQIFQGSIKPWNICLYGSQPYLQKNIIVLPLWYLYYSIFVIELTLVLVGALCNQLFYSRFGKACLHGFLVMSSSPCPSVYRALQYWNMFGFLSFSKGIF